MYEISQYLSGLCIMRHTGAQMDSKKVLSYSALTMNGEKKRSSMLSVKI